jgi:hypothetical protein
LKKDIHYAEAEHDQTEMDFIDWGQARENPLFHDMIICTKWRKSCDHSLLEEFIPLNLVQENNGVYCSRNEVDIKLLHTPAKKSYRQ